MTPTTPQEIRFCSTPDGVNIAYATIGTGYPLVRTAHYLTHLGFDLESPVWRHWIRELSRSDQLIRYDERGLGLSDWKVPEFSFEAWVRDLETVVDSLGLKRFALLGMSQGGPVSIAYTVRHPDRVSHLILYGSYAVGWGKRRASPEEAEIRKSMHKLMKLGWGRNDPTFRQLFTSQFIPGATVEQMNWFNELQRVTCPTENALKFDDVFSQIDVLELLSKVSVPTLILHAKDDRVVPFELGRQLAALIPGSKFLPLEGGNHILLEGEPAWEAFLHEVRQFVGVPSEASRSSTGGSVSALGEEELRHARQMISDSDRLTIPEFRVVGSYLRFEPSVRHNLKDLRQRVVAGLRAPTLGRENYLIWGRPGSGKTFLIQQIAESIGPGVEYSELNLAALDESALRAALSAMGPGTQPRLCLIDEVDAQPNESWPYEALLPSLEPTAGRSGGRTFVLAGSSASSLLEMKQRLSVRPKGPDLLSRIPTANEFSIPPLTVVDRIAVIAVQIDRAAREHQRRVHEVEKLALYYVVSNPRLASARQLREFAVRCVERLPAGEERIKYDHLFEPGDAENKEFWLRTRPIHPGLVETFVSIID
jgi:pimeloyl-ACP methyl ester carboxylesterase